MIRLGKKVSLIQERSEERRRQKISSSCLQHRVEAIMKFLFVGCSSKIWMRQALGYSLDNNKTLIMRGKRERDKETSSRGFTGCMVRCAFIQ
uniref:HTH three-helical bundle domain-containing protein n=1 Tax=Nelumbo nucifera TaxID=4432 RepID=A0A822XTJ7_NELNU|nr:TPA_asm: hypothetical protein HUJ06_022231 [Nelumbo nucifera]